MFIKSDGEGQCRKLAGTTVYCMYDFVRIATRFFLKSLFSQYDLLPNIAEEFLIISSDLISLNFIGAIYHLFWAL